MQDKFRLQAGRQAWAVEKSTPRSAMCKAEMRAEIRASDHSRGSKHVRSWRTFRDRKNGMPLNLN